MTRGNLMIVLVLILALVGMFFWTLTLHNRQAVLYEGAGGGDTGPRDPDASGRIGDLEKDVREVKLLVRSNIGDLNRVEGRVAELEKARAAQDGPRANVAAGGPASIAGGGTPVVDSSLREAVDAVLAEKAEEERKARVQASARRLTGYLLNEVEATDQQRQQAVGVVATYLDERDRVRRENSGSDGDSEARDAALARLLEDRNEALRQIFPADYTRIQERLERGRRWIDGRRGSPRGTGNRVSPRGTPR